jgi:uncharacterized membrane protein YqjE
MNPGNENEDPQPDRAGEVEPSAIPPTNWREALLSLIATRVDLVQLEAVEAARAAGKRAVLGAGAGACVFFAWALLLVAGISLLAHLTNWPWHAFAAIAAMVHLIAAAFLVRALRKPLPPTFSHTKNEFHKDRQWIENLQNPRKS